ncbi:MAG: hypothetical protein RL248_1523 [Pseudomonadota bacterium]|jgi:phage shock protein D
MINNKPARMRVGVILMSLLKMIFTVALTCGPAGAAGLLAKRVSSKPLRWLFLLILEPMLKHVMQTIARQFVREQHETTAK